MPQTDDPFGTIPMFDVPKKYRPPKRQQVWPKWSAYNGKRTSCDDCIRAIAKNERKFVAEPATSVREDADGRAYYCNRHTSERKQADGL